MSQPLVQLALASLAFVGLHLLMSWAPVRTPLVSRMGNLPFQMVYSLISGVCLAWMIMAYTGAPTVLLFEAGTGLRHVSLSVMAVASFLLVCGYTQPNPTAVGMERRGLEAGARGVLKITRHPVMWAITLWAVCHLLANGHVAAWIFFGSFAVLAIAGGLHIDAKRRASGGDTWAAYEQQTSFVPMGAILQGRARVERGEYRWWQIVLSVALYFGLLTAHAPVIGRYVMPF